MIAIDTSALVAIFRLEAEADSFIRLIVDADKKLISAASLLETSMFIAGRKAGDEAFEPLDEFLLEAGIEVVALDADQVRIARDAFLQFGKGRHKAALNYGDCASYALAKSRGVALLFKGSDFSQTDLTPAFATS